VATVIKEAVVGRQFAAPLGRSRFSDFISVMNLFGRRCRTRQTIETIWPKTLFTLNVSMSNRGRHQKKLVRQTEFSGKKKQKKPQEYTVKRALVVIPYVEKVSEAMARITKKYSVPVTMKPWETVKKLLVHPKNEHDM